MWSVAGKASQLMFGALKRMSEGANQKGEKEKERTGCRESNMRKRSGLRAKDIQFPVHKLKRGPLSVKASWMREDEVLQWMVEPEDDEGAREILLEAWTIGRFSHNRTSELGQLFQVHMGWGMATFKLNIIGVKDFVPMDFCAAS